MGGVFWWKPQSAAVLTAVWEDLVLLLHTMEEKQVSLLCRKVQRVTCTVWLQVHIVKPVKSRMKNIACATATVVDGGWGKMTSS